MTPAEAIKLQQDALADKWCPWSADLKDAIRLGVEGLKYTLGVRQGLPPELINLLPGETKD